MESVNVRYERVESTYEEEDKTLRTYGVAARMATGETLFAIPDISTKADLIDALVRKLAAFEISAVHAFDVLEDCVAMLYDGPILED